jgi:hypothetical protein
MARGFAENPQFINRNGRPRKGQSLTELLEKELAKKRESGKTGREELAETLIDLAIGQKDIAAIRYVYDRIDGKPTERVEQSGGDIAPEIRAALAAIFGPSGTAPAREGETP